MSEDPEVKKAETPKAKPARPRRKARRRDAGLGTILSLVVAGIVFTILFLSLSGRSIPVPGFIHASIEDRINARSEGKPFRLGAMEVGIGRDGVPQVLLSDISIADPAGGAVAHLNSLGAELSLDRLLRGEIAASTLILAGAQITLRRTSDGSFSLRTDQLEETEAASLPDVLERVDRLLAGPALAALEDINADGIVLTLEDARSGRIWQATNAKAVLRRTSEGISVSLTSDVFNGTDNVAEMQVSLSRSRVSGIVSLGAQVSDMPAADIALQAPALSWLGVLDAPISGSVRTEVAADGSLRTFAGTLDIASGALQPTEDIPPAEFDSARAYFTFDPDRQRIDFSQIALSGLGGNLLARGHSYLAELDGPWPQAFLGQFRIDQLTYGGGDLFPGPLAFDDIRADLRLRLDPFTAEIAQIVVDNEGTPVRASGRVEAREKGWFAAIDATTEKIASSRVLELWPLKVSPITRSWLAENLRGGDVLRPAAGVRFRTGEKPDVALSFEVSEGGARFLPHMPELEEVRARATMLHHRFTLTLTDGGVTAKTGDFVDATGSVFLVEDVRPKPAWGTIYIVARGSLPAALTVLDNRPVRVMERAERTPDIARADALAKARVTLPLVKELNDEDVTYDVTARLLNVRSDQLVEGRVFTARELTLRANPEGIGIDGAASLDGVPLTASWRQSFGEGAADGGRITGDVTLTPEGLETFAISLPSGLVRGSARADYVLDLPRDGPARLALTSDLQGLAMSVPALGWRKPASTGGALATEITLGEPPDVESFALSAPGLALSGDLEFNETGFRGARFDRVEVGNWLDAAVRLTPASGQTAVAVTGGTIDLRRFDSLGSGGGGGGGSAGGPVDLDLDRLILSDSVTLAPVRGRIQQTRAGLTGDFRARVNGGAAIRGSLAPANAGTALRVLSDDASGVIRDAGLTPNARGGTLDLVLTPVSGARAGTYDGQFLIEDLRLRKAPLMADLLDAISVVGLIDQLDGPGIKFATLDGRFRLTPRRLQVLEAAAVGGSLGISADGIYDFASKRLDFKGVISPVYFLNGIGSIFTRRGEGLFGFNYRMAGSVEDPRIGVNPLSILTPGMFRRIFRASPPRATN